MKNNSADSDNNRYIKIKIKINSDGDLPTTKSFLKKLYGVALLTRSVFEDNNTLYPQIFLEEFLYKLKMLYHDRIDFKKRASKECVICHYWKFLEREREFRFQLFLSNGCHNLLMISTDINSVAILYIHGVDYRCTIVGISKSKAINLLKMLFWLK